MANSKEFVKWLYKKLNVKSDQELKDALQKMGDSGVKSKYQEFQKEQEGMNNDNSEETQEMKNGGKLDYLKCLQEFKKGGKMKSCGCGSKMQKGGHFKMKNAPKMKSKFKEEIPMAQFGAILGAAKSAFGAAKTLGAASKIGNTLGTIDKIGGTVGQIANTLQPKTNNVPMMATQTVSTVNPSQVPGGIVTTAQTTPKLNARSIPNVKMEEGGEIDNPKLAKLKALKNKKKVVK